MKTNSALNEIIDHGHVQVHGDDEHKERDDGSFSIAIDQVVDDSVVPVYPIDLSQLAEYVRRHRAGEEVAEGSLNQYIQNLIGHDTVVADLSGKIIRNIDLSNIDLSEVYFYQSTFERSVICNNTSFAETHCLAAIFRCDLSSADFSMVITNGDTDFSAALLLARQAKQILHRQELELQYKGVRCFSMVGLIAASTGTAFATTGAGLVPVVVTFIAGAAASMFVNEVGKRVLQLNVDTHTGILNGRFGDELSELGAVQEVISIPAGVGVSTAGIATVTRAVPYLSPIAAAISVASFAYGVHQGRGAVNGMRSGVSAPEVVANQGTLIDGVHDIEHGIANAGTIVADAIDRIPFCHKLKNALIFGAVFTSAIGGMILGLVLGGVMKTDNLPSTSGSIFAAVIGTFISSTGVAFCFHRATECFVKSCCCIVTKINCCFNCGKTSSGSASSSRSAEQDVHRPVTPTNLHEAFVNYDGSPHINEVTQTPPSHVQKVLARISSKRELVPVGIEMI